MKLHIVSNSETIKPMKDEKKKFPNNLHRLMKRDGVSARDIAQAWGVEMGDVSQRINEHVSITSKRREILHKEFGWTSSELFDAAPINDNPLEKWISQEINKHLRPYQEQIEFLKGQILDLAREIAKSATTKTPRVSKPL